MSKNQNNKQEEEQNYQFQEPLQSQTAAYQRDLCVQAEDFQQDKDILQIKQGQNQQDNYDHSLNYNLCINKYESNQVFRDSPQVNFLKFQKQNEQFEDKEAKMSLEIQHQQNSDKDVHSHLCRQNNNQICNDNNQQGISKNNQNQWMVLGDEQVCALQFPSQNPQYYNTKGYNQQLNKQGLSINAQNQNDNKYFPTLNAKSIQNQNSIRNQLGFNDNQKQSKQLVLNAEETQLERNNQDLIEEQEENSQQKYPEYFNLTDNQKLEEICSKVFFVRNTLSRHFGKLKRNGQVVENESLILIDQEFKLTERQKQQRDHLVLSLRRRSQIFLILNVIWVTIIGLTYIQSENWFKMKTLDNLSLRLLVTADGITILQLVVWTINIFIGLCGMVNFSLACLKIYQIVVLFTIFFEILTNVLILNFVPISLAKSLALILFHVFFIFACKIVQNAMLAFRAKYISILYHYQLTYTQNELENQSTNNNQNRDSQLQKQNKENVIFTYSPKNKNRADVENNFGVFEKTKQNPAQGDDNENSTGLKKPLPQNLYKNYLNRNQPEQQQDQVKKFKQIQSQCVSDQTQPLVLARQAHSNKSEESKEQIFKNQINQQKSQKEKKLAFSVADLQGEDEVGFQQKKSDIGSFPIYEKSQDKRGDQEELIKQLNNINHDMITNPSEKSFHTKQQKNNQINIERKGTTISSNAQGSQTTLPSNCCYIQRNNPSQVEGNIEDEDIHVDII